MITAALWAAPFLALAAVAAYARSILSGRRVACLPRVIAYRATRAALRVLIAVLTISPVRAAILRARWAWRCRGHPPVPGRSAGLLTASEIRALRAIGRRWKHPASTEGSRT